MPRQKKPPSIVNDIKPHTVKKFELIERYVDEWARKILGVKNSDGVIFIDCMCNSGLYCTSDGESIVGTPIRISKLLNTIMENYPDKKALLFFNDFDKEKIDALSKEIEALNLDKVTISYSVGDGNVFLRAFQISKYPNYNKLLFYDPYMASIDWDAISPFLRCWGEVIINHMISDTVRGISQANRADTVHKYELTYQKDKDDLLKLGYDKTALDDVVMGIFKKYSDGLQNQTYIASFPFYNRNNVLLYNLIHYSQNIHGFKLYKKVAWQCFGGKSSLKKDKIERGQVEGQIQFLMPEPDIQDDTKDYKNYGIDDIAEYIYEKFKGRDEVLLTDIYDELDKHPVFPSEGFRSQIKNALKENHPITCAKTTIRYK